MFATKKPTVILKVGSYDAVPKTEAELDALNINAAARSLTDNAFGSDPGVIQAGDAVDAWRTRLDRLAAYPAKSHAIATLAAGLEAELDAAKQSYRFACLDDFLTGAHDFDDAIAAKQRVTLLENRLDAVKTARPDIDRSPTDMGALRELYAQAEAKFNRTLFELKKQSVLHSDVATVCD